MNTGCLKKFLLSTFLRYDSLLIEEKQFEVVTFVMKQWLIMSMNCDTNLHNLQLDNTNKLLAEYKSNFYAYQTGSHL